MSARRAVFSLFFLVGLPVAVPATATAGEFSARAQQEAQRAEALIAARRWNAAEEFLQAALSRCGGDRSCEALLFFTRGYLHQEKARSRGERRDLEAAARWYGRALEQSPEDPVIAGNLALVWKALGARRQAEALATRTLEEHPDRAYEWRLFLGDLAADAGDLEEARKHYLLAEALAPGREEARRRVLSVLKAQEPASARSRRLAEYALKLEAGFPALAAEALEAAIGAAHAEDPGAAEDLLVRWTAIRADVGSLSLWSLGALPLPSQWPSRGLAELRAVLADPSGASPDTPWWLKTAPRRDALARVWRKLARDRRAEGDLEGCVKLLDRAIAAAPDPWTTLTPEFAGRSNAQLDAVLDLVTVYDALGDDRRSVELAKRLGQQTEELTEILFSGKGRAYSRNDLVAIQRYHTVLGLIYFKKGRLTSTWADNAIFQLEHALKTAEQRAQEDAGQYQPLPELQIRLAQAYRQLRDGRKAGVAAVAAAIGYLDLDDLKGAGGAVRLAREAGASETSLSGVTRVLDTRLRLAAGQMTAAVAAGKTHELPAADRWLLEPQALALPKDFLERQRFKTLADLGAQAVRDGNPAQARFFSAKALEAASRQAVLPSLQDVLRIESVETQLMKEVTLEGSGALIQSGRGLEAAPLIEGAQRWTVPAGGSTYQVLVRPELLAAGVVQQTLEVGRALEEKKVDLRIEKQGRVVVEPKVLELQDAERLRQIIQTSPPAPSRFQIILKETAPKP